MLKYLEQTPAYQRWKTSLPIGREDNLRTFQNFLARVDQMLCLMDVVWPKFIEKEGLILREGNLPDSWESFSYQAQEAKWSLSDMEYVINHLHVYDLFLNDPDRDEIDNTVFSFLAKNISEMWRCKLHSLFPEKNFVIGVANIETDPEIYAYLQREDG